MEGQITSPESEIVKSNWYYVPYGIEIILLAAAGVLAFATTKRGTVDKTYNLYFALFMGASLLMTARGYTVSDLFSTRLVDSTGPFPSLIAMLIFVGSRRRNWTVLGPAMAITCVIFSGLALIAIARLQSAGRWEAVVRVGYLLRVLYWTGAWVMLKEYSPSSFARHLRFIPILIFALGSVFTQTRLYFIQVAAVFLVYAYVQRRRRLPQFRTWLVMLGVGIWACLFVVVCLKNTRAFDLAEESASAFYSRIDEDTRSDQLTSFFTSVAPGELVLGRGSFATWDWGGTPYRGGTDVGYLTLLLYGGVPLLLTYIATHILPAFRVFRSKARGPQLTAAGVVALWAITMFSSASPTAIMLEHYPLLFCIGACISKEETVPVRTHEYGMAKVMASRGSRFGRARQQAFS
jgi:hypothetical protein